MRFVVSEVPLYLHVLKNRNGENKEKYLFYYHQAVVQGSAGAYAALGGTLTGGIHCQPSQRRKHGLSTEQFPVSAYVGSSKNLKDLKA